jgi:hypothetical protein
MDGFWRVESSQTPARGPQFGPNVQKGRKVLRILSTQIPLQNGKNVLFSATNFIVEQI